MSAIKLPVAAKTNTAETFPETMSPSTVSNTDLLNNETIDFSERLVKKEIRSNIERLVNRKGDSHPLHALSVQADAFRIVDDASTPALQQYAASEIFSEIPKASGIIREYLEIAHNELTKGTISSQRRKFEDILKIWEADEAY